MTEGELIPELHDVGKLVNRRWIMDAISKKT